MEVRAKCINADGIGQGLELNKDYTIDGLILNRKMEVVKVRIKEKRDTGNVFIFDVYRFTHVLGSLKDLLEEIEKEGTINDILEYV